jgi:hypothetical protein
MSVLPVLFASSHSLCLALIADLRLSGMGGGGMSVIDRLSRTATRGCRRPEVAARCPKDNREIVLPGVVLTVERTISQLRLTIKPLIAV